MSELTKEYGEKFVDRLKRCLDHMDENNEIEIIMDREGLEECIAALSLRTRDAGDEEVHELYRKIFHGTWTDAIETNTAMRDIAISRGQQLAEARKRVEELEAENQWIRSVLNGRSESDG